MRKKHSTIITNQGSLTEDLTHYQSNMTLWRGNLFPHSLCKQKVKFPRTYIQIKKQLFTFTGICVFVYILSAIKEPCFNYGLSYDNLICIN